LGPTYNNIGLIYSKKGEWDKALEYYGKSEQIYIEVGNKAGLGPTYNNIGGIYDKKGEWDKALEYYGKSEQIRIEVGDKAGLGYTNWNIATIYFQLNDRQAIKRINKAVAIFRELGAKHELQQALEWQEMINTKFNNLPLIKENEQRMWLKFKK
jgi:tetratricopeptide (TPR) repeat protein